MYRPVFVLRLRSPLECRADVMRRLAARRTAARVESFLFKSDEARFARELLARRTHLWLYRANQRLFCGDFLVVDVSSPRLDRRTVVAVDLKRARPLRRAGGVQLARAAEARDELVRLGVVGAASPLDTLVGDGGRLLARFGAPPA